MLLFIFYLDYPLRGWGEPRTMSLQRNQRRGKQAITPFCCLQILLLLRYYILQDSSGLVSRGKPCLLQVVTLTLSIQPGAGAFFRELSIKHFGVFLDSVIE